VGTRRLTGLVTSCVKENLSSYRMALKRRDDTGN
jgi:hypothetical protein